MSRRLRIVVVLGAVWLVLTSFGTAWGLYSRFSVSNAARKDNRALWHAVICTIVTTENRRTNITTAVKLQQEEFWNSLLVSVVGTDPCRVLPR